MPTITLTLGAEETSSNYGRVDVTEGRTPYSYEFSWVVQPNAEIGYVIQNTNEVKITTTANVLDGIYAGQIRADVEDALGQIVSALLDVDVTVELSVFPQLNGILDYRFQQASGDLINDGTLGPTYDMEAKQTPQFQAESPGGGIGPYSIEFDGVESNPYDGFHVPNSGGPDFDADLTSPVGTLLLAFKVLANVPAQSSSIAAFNGATAAYRYIEVGTTLSTGNLRFNSSVNATTSISNWRAKDINSGLGLQDGGWHYVAIVQDGASMQMFLDGEDKCVANVTAAAQDQWLDLDGATSLTVGARGNTTDITDRPLDGRIGHLLISPSILTHSQIYAATVEFFGEAFTQRQAYNVYLRSLWGFGFTGNGNVNGNWIPFISIFQQFCKGPMGYAGSWNSSGTSNPAPGGALITDGPSGSAWTALRLTGQWRFADPISGHSPKQQIWGTTRGSWGIWFRRPNAAAVTAKINTLASHGSNSEQAGAPGFNVAFCNEFFVNDPNSLTVGWQEEFVGLGLGTNQAFQHFDVAHLDDSDWHLIVVAADGINPLHVYIDGVLQVAFETTEAGYMTVESWAGAMVSTTYREGTGAGTNQRTYADICDRFTLPGKPLTQQQAQNLYQIGIGTISVQGVTPLLVVPPSGYTYSLVVGNSGLEWGMTSAADVGRIYPPIQFDGRSITRLFASNTEVRLALGVSQGDSLFTTVTADIEGYGEVVMTWDSTFWTVNNTTLDDYLIGLGVCATVGVNLAGS